jgi:NAD(P)-dependent dehydrogenase (short-subunit alcohol dehydrogenase family)
MKCWICFWVAWGPRGQIRDRVSRRPSFRTLGHTGAKHPGPGISDRGTAEQMTISSGSQARATSSHIPTVLITGGNRGLGLACAEAAARRDPVQLILACRDPERGEAAAARLRRSTPGVQVSVLSLDLGSLSSVRSAVQALRAGGQLPLSAVICNAGIWLQSNLIRSPDGFEQTFATNHLGHALLVLELLPHCTSDARIVMVSSALHDPAAWRGGPEVRYIRAALVAHPEQDPRSDRSAAAAGSRAYATSKLCTLLFANELARRFARSDRYRRVTVNSFNPGLMAGTGLNRNASLGSRLVWTVLLPRLRGVIPGSFTPQHSGETLAALALDNRFAGVTGRYFGTLHEEMPSPEARDPLKADDLWTFTVQATRPDTELPTPSL